jgi:hypothetical protein
MKPTEFATRAWIAQLTQRTGQRLTWEQRAGVHVIRRDGALIGTMTSLAAVETFLHGYEHGIQTPNRDATDSELDQAA